MVDHALKNGWDNSTGGFYDEGYSFKDKPGITIIADTKNWWAQAEGLNTLLMFDDMYPKDSLQYGQKFYKALGLRANQPDRPRAWRLVPGRDRQATQLQNGS
jgi:mannose/cellobiose epimerase-like protein (N-acyl-D-glucosamine 2-epimerase family)